MKHFITTTSLLAALAISGSAFAGSVDEDLHKLCMDDSANSMQSCNCTVSLVKSSMNTKDYILLHALATTEDGSEERTSKLAALAPTPEEMQAVGTKFNALIGDIKTQCNVTIETGGGAEAG